ncbi:anti-sigma factor [Anaeroarcus burkinensis]|uniref:anti-sigma factor n=1 Tax=Anaeroarcus burkinensis TaxID=82376 RepID=UPI00040C8172|nr:anti-sigma factor [Anaeroarcus burkinensis]
MNRQLEQDAEKKQEALSAALDRLNAGEEKLQESEDLAGFLETARWVRQSVEPPPQLLQETLERLEAQASLPEDSLPEKTGLLPPRKRSWLYAGALGLAASVLLALQLLPSSPLPVAVAPEEAQQAATLVAVAPLRDKDVMAAEPVQESIPKAREEAAVMSAAPILAAAAEVAGEPAPDSGEVLMARAEPLVSSRRAKLYEMRAVRLFEGLEPVVLPGEAADVVWHDERKTIWRHVYRQDTPQEVAVTQWRPERLQEKEALQRAAAVLGGNRLVLFREERVLVLEGQGGEAELRKIAAALVEPGTEK